MCHPIASLFDNAIGFSLRKFLVQLLQPVRDNVVALVSAEKRFFSR